jgi:sugar phosphate isomerase/epimerase
VPERLLSLAAGVVLDLDPADAVDVAAEAGFGAVGIWHDPLTWTLARSRAVARRLAATGLVALDIEPVILGRGVDPGDAVVDVAADIGAGNVLVASGPAEPELVADRLAELCDRAAAAETRVNLEFLPIFSIGSLELALQTIYEIDRPNGGVLVDTLHLARSGGEPADLVAVPSARLPYLQIADAPWVGPDTSDGLRDEALHGRQLPGAGQLPLAEVLRAVPGVPLSFEIRSSELMARYPDPLERARAVLAAGRALLRSESVHTGRA